MSRPSCSDCKHESKDWADWPCRECSVVMLDGQNMWEPVAEPKVRKECNNCGHLREDVECSACEHQCCTDYTDAYPGWIPKEEPVVTSEVMDEVHRCHNCGYGHLTSDEEPCASFFTSDVLNCPYRKPEVPVEEPVAPTAPLRFTNEDMEVLLSNLQVDEMAVWAGKNSDYASRGANGDPFTNFDDIAADTGITPEQVLYIYMAKHLRAIRAYITHGTLESGESLWGRIIDARNYLAILAGMAKAKGDL